MRAFLRAAKGFNGRNINQSPISRITPTWTSNLHLSNSNVLYRSICGTARHLDISKESGKKHIKIDKPTYSITFTCKQCMHRSSHFMSHQAYHNGTVLIQCPSCKNRHLIADHLKIFSDEKITLEDILAKLGEEVVKGRIDEEQLFQFEPSEDSPEEEHCDKRPPLLK
ncbi:zf-DNL-domain-containing protein [Dipodascopsis tothii]|uniref:zf-DNL-domain-containing protein n=1 Tax=Dipodascopsis tothii TaxID=44089 RepID=UPI0034CE991D